MVPPARRPLVFSLLAGALIAVFLLQSFWASSIKTPAFDETGDIAAGVSYADLGRFTVNLQHPPLLKELSGLFLLAAGIHYPNTPSAQRLLAGDRTLQWAVGSNIIYRGGLDRVMFWARLPMILLAAGLGIVIFLWGRQMLGVGAALGALFLFALDPTVVAHGYLVTLDVGLAAFTVLFCFVLWNYLRAPSLGRLAWCGVTLGLLLATKFSALVLLPVAGLLVLAAMWKPPESGLRAARGFWNPYAAPLAGGAKTGPNDPCPCGSGKKFKKCHGADGKQLAAESGVAGRVIMGIAIFAGMCVAAAIVVDATYFFSDLSLYTTGMNMVNADHTTGYQMYLHGDVSPRFLTYFLVAWLVKEPLASIALVILGLEVVTRSRTLTQLDKLFLLLPPAALFVAHTLLADDIGIRYIIPVLPFGYLLGGAALAELAESTALWKRATAGVLSVWMAVAAIGIFPDHLSYFNESACLLENPLQVGLDGGSRCGIDWLDDSNLDWGEGLKQLKAWLDRHAPAREINLAYFGSYPPDFFGLKYKNLLEEDLLRAPTPGLYVVSAHGLLRGRIRVKLEGIKTAEWLKRPPDAVIGHCMFVYDIR